MKFIGSYINKIDDKGRMIVPSNFKKILDTTIFLSLEFENTLVIRTKDDFQKWENELKDLDPLKKSTRTLQRLILGNSEKIKIDSKGRINIPNILLKNSNIGKNVVVVGVGNKIEIHSEDVWNEMNTNKFSLEDAAEEISKK